MAGRNWRLAQGTVSTPHGTAIASPQTTKILTGDNYVQWIRWRFPPGPNGELGISFWNLGAQIVPWVGVGTFIIGDNEDETATVEYPALGSLSLVTYNLGTYDHIIIYSIQYQPIAVTTAGDSGGSATNLIDLIASEALSQPPEVSVDNLAELEVSSSAG